MKKGFTLIEILVAIAVVAILASLALPRWVKMQQKITQRQAESYLRAIRVSQKMYYARYAAYACSTACANAASVKTALGTVLRDGNYTFSTASTLSGGVATFVATANGGALGTITIDQDGNFQKDGVAYTPPS